MNYEILSGFGVSICASMFIVQQWKTEFSKTFVYLSMNATGSGICMIGAYGIGSAAFVAINALIFAVSVVGILRKKSTDA